MKSLALKDGNQNERNKMSLPPRIVETQALRNLLAVHD